MQDIKEKRDADLLVLPTDAALFEDPSFKVTKPIRNLREMEKSRHGRFCFHHLKLSLIVGMC